MSRRFRAGLAVVVIAVAVTVLAGVGQGQPGRQITVSARRQASSRARLARLGAQAVAGRQAFSTYGCSACHTIAVSGYGGRLGPNLDGYLHGLPRAAIRAFIVDPLSVEIPGYTHDLMPNDFGRRLPRATLAALVAYLHAVAG